MTTSTPQLKTATGTKNPVRRNCLKTTRKKAIDAMCAHCMGCSSSLQGDGYTNYLEPGFRGFITHCTARGCPLYPWRPFKG